MGKKDPTAAGSIAAKEIKSLIAHSGAGVSEGASLTGEAGEMVAQAAERVREVSGRINEGMGFRTAWVDRWNEALEPYGYVPDWQVKDFVGLGKVMETEKP